jgi:serine/threonine protein kinase
MLLNFFVNILVRRMATDAATDGFLRVIEGRHDIDARFTNLRRVGATGGDGHSSLVFVALDNQTRREVAVKVFRPDRQVDTYRYQCFCREEKILRTLAGTPNVVGWVACRSDFVEQVTTSAGISFPVTFPYFAVELAVEDVAAVIRNGTWNPEQKLVGFREMCKAVQRIRKRGITHRDIKPSNFLVTAAREVKLSDFGTARDLSGSEPAIVANYGFPPGDLRYAPPEMLALLHDEDPSIAFAGDIYGLGVTLFELFSGVILGVQLFTPRFVTDLAQAMNAVHKRERFRIFSEFVQSLAAGNPLPAISGFGGDLPTSIRSIVEDLYRSMASLDYRQRLCDFERIFLRIDQCLLVLRNEEKVRRWHRRKAILKRNREQKRARLLGAA